MNSEPKPLASLSSGLLARKGAARPAMRPQGFGQMGANLEDLGWNDMGFEPPKPADPPVRDEEHDAFGEAIPSHPHNLAGLTPVDSPVHNQQAEIAGRLSAFSPQDAGEEDVDETAELYDPDSEDCDEPVVARPKVQAITAERKPEPAKVEAIVAKVEPSRIEPAKVEPDKVEPAKVEPEKVEPTKAEPAMVNRAQAEAVARQLRKPRAAPGSKAKAAFTLRLDPDRHLKLRLACALDGRSAQQLVTQALDDLLQSMPELDALVAKAKRKG